MADQTKTTLVRNLLKALQERTGATQITPAQAEAELRRVGIAPGTAHRVMDDETNVGVETVATVAQRLGLTMAQLFDGQAQPVTTPTAIAHLAATLRELPPERMNKIRGLLDLLTHHPEDPDLADLLARWLSPQPAAEPEAPHGKRTQRAA